MLARVAHCVASTQRAHPLTGELDLRSADAHALRDQRNRRVDVPRLPPCIAPAARDERSAGELPTHTSGLLRSVRTAPDAATRSNGRWDQSAVESAQQVPPPGSAPIHRAARQDHPLKTDCRRRCLGGRHATCFGRSLRRAEKPVVDCGDRRPRPFRLPSVVNRCWRGFRPVGSSACRVVRRSVGSAGPGVADPKCRCAGVGRPRWILETPRSALPGPRLRLGQRR